MLLAKGVYMCDNSEYLSSQITDTVYVLQNCSNWNFGVDQLLTSISIIISAAISIWAIWYMSEQIKVSKRQQHNDKQISLINALNQSFNAYMKHLSKTATVFAKEFNHDQSSQDVSLLNPLLTSLLGSINAFKLFPEELLTSIRDISFQFQEIWQKEDDLAKVKLKSQKLLYDATVVQVKVSEWYGETINNLK